MTAKKRNSHAKFIKKVLPYFVIGSLTLGLVFSGSLYKKDADTNLNLDALAQNNYKISVDQLSAMHTVADISSALGLASASDAASNYVVAASMYAAGQTSAEKLEKPSITNIVIPRGVIEYTVAEGESMDSIAKKYGVSTNDIRWSNNKKTTDVAVGDVLYIPSKSGIVYTVKSGDTVESIVEKYGSNAAEIIALNDLENSGIAEGMRILIKGGVLPEKERPEYVPPVIVRPTYAYTYTYLGDTATRINLVCNRALGAGQCTTWGWIKRPDLGFIRGNANRWDDIARAHGLLVNRTPSAGAIFQTDSGRYGHVGYVESVNSDGSINVSERNYAGCRGVLFSTIPASVVGRFNYIH